MKKKLFSVMLAAAMAASLLVGCGSGAPASSGGGNGKVGMLEQINPVITGNRFRNLFLFPN